MFTYASTTDASSAGVPGGMPVCITICVGMLYDLRLYGQSGVVCYSHCESSTPFLEDTFPANHSLCSGLPACPCAPRKPQLLTPAG